MERVVLNALDKKHAGLAAGYPALGDLLGTRLQEQPIHRRGSIRFPRPVPSVVCLCNVRKESTRLSTPIHILP